MEANGIGGGRERGGIRQASPNGAISPRGGRLNERRRAEAAVIDPKYHTSIPPPRPQISTRFGCLHVVGQAGPMVVREKEAHANKREILRLFETTSGSQ